MKTEIQFPTKSYPYLAIFGGGFSLDEVRISKITIDQIYLISMTEKVSERNGGPGKEYPYVQSLLGGKEGYFITRESDWIRLPSNYSITLTQ